MFAVVGAAQGHPYFGLVSPDPLPYGAEKSAVRLRRLIKELLRYLKNNQDSLANYGRRYRSGRRISTAFKESAVNQLIDKRMSKA